MLARVIQYVIVTDMSGFRVCGIKGGWNWGVAGFSECMSVRFQSNGKCSTFFAQWDIRIVVGQGSVVLVAIDVPVGPKRNTRNHALLDLVAAWEYMTSGRVCRQGSVFRDVNEVSDWACDLNYITRKLKSM